MAEDIHLSPSTAVASYIIAGSSSETAKNQCDTSLSSENSENKITEAGGAHVAQTTIETPDSLDSSLKLRKCLSVSVAILFLIWICSIISSIILIKQLKHETLQNANMIREQRNLQKKTSIGFKEDRKEVHLILALQQSKLDAVSSLIKNMTNELHETQQTQDGLEYEIGSIFIKIDDIEKKLQNARQIQDRQEANYTDVLSEIHEFQNQLSYVIQNQSSQERRTSAAYSEMRKITTLPFLHSCDYVNQVFTHITEGTGRAVRVLSALGGVQAYCENINDQMWTVFQRRKNGRVDFFRDWNDYVRGFGVIEGEFWLGLEALHQLTKVGGYQLRIEMKAMNGTRLFAAYRYFSIASGSENYRLRVRGYSGNATDSLGYQNNRTFSAEYTDKDFGNPGTCFNSNEGAWWYRNCHHVNLNGVYGVRNDSGIVWTDIGHNINMYMGFTEMKLRKRPVE